MGNKPNREDIAEVVEEILAEKAAGSDGAPAIELTSAGAEISVADNVFVKGTDEATEWAAKNGLDWRPMKDTGQYSRVRVQSAVMVVTVKEGVTDISVWYLVKGEGNNITPVPVELLKAVG